MIVGTRSPSVDGEKADNEGVRGKAGDEAVVKDASHRSPPLKPTTRPYQRSDSPSLHVSARLGTARHVQVRVRQMEGLEELSWGELEGKDSKVEPSKSRLAALKGAWDDGIFDL